MVPQEAAPLLGAIYISAPEGWVSMTLIFTSVTYALKAQRLLAAQHIHSSLTRSSAVTAVRGCGYGLRLADGTRAEEAQTVLAQNGIRVLGAVREG